jgi:O-antigen ligase
MAAMAVGVITAGRPSLGVGVLVGLIYAPLVLINLPVGIALWIALVFSQHLSIVSIAPNAALILIGLAWLGGIRERAPVIREVLARHKGLVFAFACLLGWVTLSMLWARSVGQVSSDFWQWYVAAVLVLIVSTTFTSAKSVKILLALFVAGAVVSVLVGLIASNLSSSLSAIDTATHTEGRLQGGGGDPNYLAAGLVPAMVVAAGLVTVTRSAIGRWSLMGALGLLAVGLAATESRGGLLAAVVAISLAALIYRGRRGQILMLLAVAASVGAVWFTTSPGAWHRVTSFNGGGNGRSDIWRVAWEIGKDHPIAGVGLNNFMVVSPDYTRRPGTLRNVQMIVDHPHVVHNVYLQLLAEVGVVGLGLYFVVVLALLASSWHAARRFDEIGETGLASLARAVLIASVGTLAASVFISNVTDDRVWVLLGVGPALLVIASRRGASTVR